MLTNSYSRDTYYKTCCFTLEFLYNEDKKDKGRLKILLRRLIIKEV